MVCVETSLLVHSIYCPPTRIHTESQRHGSSRSLVRQIGSRLPISTGKRIYIRVSSNEPVNYYLAPHYNSGYHTIPTYRYTVFITIVVTIPYLPTYGYTVSIVVLCVK